MKKHLLNSLPFALAGLLVVGTGMTLVARADEKKAAKKPQAETVKATKTRGGEADPNIKAPASNVNSEAKRSPAPAGKGDGAQRGAITRVHVDNRTPWIIQIFIDGEYRGVVSPWGDGYCNAISGATTFYAVADFDDGSRKTWGPRKATIDGTYTWTLTE